MEQKRLMIKDYPKKERPRERLVKKGVDALSDAELLAIILRNGSFGQNVLEISTRLLQEFDLKSLSRQRISKLRDSYGIGYAKACQIVAAFELGRRANGSSDKKVKIHSAKDVFRLYKHEFIGLQKEYVKGIFLNTRNEIIKEEIIFVGTLNSSLIHPRDIFQIALIEGAVSLILVHNHPSGDPTPSKEDVDVTKGLIECGKMLDISLFDHIVIGSNSYVSLLEEGHI